jgi:hypothetical protein
MSESNVPLNIGAGGASVAVFQDATGNVHQEVVVQTQNGGSDPVSVSAANPMPVVVSAAIPAGANVIGGVTQSGNWLIQGNVPAAGADAGNGIKVSAVYHTSAPTYTDGQRSDLQTDAAGNLCVNIKAGSNPGGTSSNFAASFPSAGTAIGALNSAGTLMQPLNLDASGNLKIALQSGGVPAQQDNTAFTAGTSMGLAFSASFNDSMSAIGTGNAGSLRCTANRQLLTVPQAAPNGGATPFTLVTGASVNNANLKASPGQIYGIQVVNVGATLAYLKIFNKATAATLATDTPVMNIPIPANTTGAGVVIQVPVGISFTNGISYAVTAGIALLDNTALALANLVAVNIQYS